MLYYHRRNGYRCPVKRCYYYSLMGYGSGKFPLPSKEDQLRDLAHHMLEDHPIRETITFLGDCLVELMELTEEE